jgi:osmoprotectant transport system permease protein
MASCGSAIARRYRGVSVSSVLAEDIGSKWLHWPWVTDHLEDIRAALVEHVELTLYAMAIGLAVSVGLGLLCLRSRRVYGPVLAITGILYTIPSLAFFAVMVPVFGLFSIWTAVVPLALYTLLILVRNIVTGFEGVPPEVKEAAQGMGYSRRRQLWRVELPLALPAIVVGIRIAIVTTIGLVTVTALIGQGGLGALIIDGFNRDFRTPLTIGVVLSLALALLADLLLIAALWLATPWERADRGRAGRRRRAARAATMTASPTDAIPGAAGRPMTEAGG